MIRSDKPGPPGGARTGAVAGHGDGDGAGGTLLTVTAFAARARLSPKALRLYDRCGLLHPAHVDAASGRRYYRADQLELARTVALLRQLDMPVATIAEVVREPGEQGARRVAGYWRGVEARIAAQRPLVEYLRTRIAARGAVQSGLTRAFEVQEADMPAQYVISQRRRTLVHELPAWIGGSLERLLAGARECGGAAGAPFVVYHAEVGPESDGPAETCVPVRSRAAAGAWALKQGRAWGTTAREEPAHRIAYTRLIKAHVAFPQIVAAYEAVEEWIARQGLKVAGPSREIYFAPDLTRAAPGDEVCDVAFPVVG